MYLYIYLIFDGKLYYFEKMVTHVVFSSTQFLLMHVNKLENLNLIILIIYIYNTVIQIVQFTSSFPNTIEILGIWQFCFTTI